MKLLWPTVPELAG